VHRLRPGRVSLVSPAAAVAHGMNDDIRGTRGALAPGGGEGKGSGVQCNSTRLPPMSQLCRKIRGSLSLASVVAARICSACRLDVRAARRRLAPASRESWSCCAA
jgi:hypothetical protein